MIGDEVEVVTVPEAQAGQRLDVFLAAHLQVSRSRARKLLETASLNGVAAKASHEIRPGDEVRLAGAIAAEPEAAELAPVAGGPLPPILYEDEALIVVDKPRGLAVHPGAGERQATLVDLLRVSGRPLSSVGPPERGGIVHRLDKDTSGVMVVCKTDAAHLQLAQAFEQRRITKTYTALVCGVPPERGRIEVPIARHPVQRKKMTVNAAGRPAVTEYTVQHTWRKYARLSINLLTGRTHQIRVHLSYINHPVVGDPLYGGLRRALDTAPSGEASALLQKFGGQALHSTTLAFEHPLSGQPLRFEAPLPADMVDLMAAFDAASR